MLPAMQRLLELTHSSSNWRLGRLLKQFVQDHGGAADADAALDVVLAPGDLFTRAKMLSIIRVHGNLGHADLLHQHLFDGPKLRAEFVDIESDLYWTLGWLGHPSIFESAVAALVAPSNEYGFGAASKGVCLCLLHFDCSSIQSELAERLTRCFDRNIFDEFVPALMCKMDDPRPWIQEFVRCGRSIMSTDCNGGTLLGLALSGDSGRDAFIDAVWDPWWEATASATGSSYWSYAGLKHLNVGFRDVMAETERARADGNSERMTQGLLLIESMLKRRFVDGTRHHHAPLAALCKPHLESALEIQEILFKDQVNIHDFASQNSRLDAMFYPLERQLDLLVRMELELEHAHAV